MRILAIESSCDESAVAVLDGESRRFTHEFISSQIAIHRQFGGVVPDLAGREHRFALPKLIERWRESDSFVAPDMIAITYGPGLACALDAGLSVARELANFYECPLLGINHLRGHALSPFIPMWQENQPWSDFFPHLGLLVSGGNTLLFSMNESFIIQVLAETVDDAAGEALDKGARMLGLPYPGGGPIEKLARGGNAKAYNFPRAFTPSTRKFSFSGLKTSLLYQLQKMQADEILQCKSDLCASYLQAVCDALVKKVDYITGEFGPRSIGFSGGVSQNGILRGEMENICSRRNLPLLLTPRQYCGDNASMIAFAAMVDASSGEISPTRFHPKLKL
ncbi:MAG: tRNA (adenosine(37)-N6)-threonylcarbamoyltransferase complex transferase subunit TsaD [Puniceicoccales bacterium]|jgi:N6-L-threonylcarbamoyladenine synthase|nr:tRNA (adenosine(37)-N6)-threonylcarbamoyltransferase complex transferase subunit TsaD [Puniceicoccales bacterium]